MAKPLTSSYVGRCRIDYPAPADGSYYGHVSRAGIGLWRYKAGDRPRCARPPNMSTRPRGMTSLPGKTRVSMARERSCGDGRFLLTERGAGFCRQRADPPRAGSATGKRWGRSYLWPRNRRVQADRSDGSWPTGDVLLLGAGAFSAVRRLRGATVGHPRRDDRTGTRGWAAEELGWSSGSPTAGSTISRPRRRARAGPRPTASVLIYVLSDNNFNEAETDATAAVPLAAVIPSRSDHAGHDRNRKRDCASLLSRLVVPHRRGRRWPRTSRSPATPVPPQSQ